MNNTTPSSLHSYPTETSEITWHIRDPYLNYNNPKKDGIYIVSFFPEDYEPTEAFSDIAYYNAATRKWTADFFSERELGGNILGWAYYPKPLSVSYLPNFQRDDA